MKKITKTALALGGSAAVLGAGAYTVLSLMDDALFNRYKAPSAEFSSKVSSYENDDVSELLEKNLKWVEDYGYETYYMESDRGEKLKGYLMKPEKESDVYVFGAHGYRSTGKIEFCGFCQYYLKRGYNVFFPDHVASGESEGTYCTFGYYESMDSMKWLKFMKENFGENIKLILHGVSMGAATVMMMSARSDLPENVKMIVADCGFTSSYDMFVGKLNQLGLPGKLSYGIVKGVDKVNLQRVGVDLSLVAPNEAVKEAKVPMLFVHGDSDGLVPCEMSYKNYNACASKEKEIVIFEGANHARCWVVDEEKYCNKLTEWTDKFVEEKKPEVKKAPAKKKPAQKKAKKAEE